MTARCFRSSVAILALVFAGQASAFAQDKPPLDEPFRSHSGDLTVLFHKGDGPIQLHYGFNEIDTPRPLNCRSHNGCFIIFQSEMEFGDATYSICGFVDGVSAKPHCAGSVSFQLGSSRQMASVAKGQHIVQTKVLAQPPYQPGTIGTWEVDYTLYEGTTAPN